jgi:hypothetical protein
MRAIALAQQGKDPALVNTPGIEWKKRGQTLSFSLSLSLSLLSLFVFFSSISRCSSSLFLVPGSPPMMSGMVISPGPPSSGSQPQPPLSPPQTAPNPSAPSVAAVSSPTPSPAAPPPPAPTASEFVLSVEERQRYEQTFARADDDLDGYVTGEQARALFAKSGLPFSDLRKIWALSDMVRETERARQRERERERERERRSREKDRQRKSADSLFLFPSLLTSFF